MVFEVNVAVVKGSPPLGRSWLYFLVDAALLVPFGGMGQPGGPNSLRDRLLLEGRSGHQLAAKSPPRGPYASIYGSFERVAPQALKHIWENGQLSQFKETIQLGARSIN